MTLIVVKVLVYKYKRLRMITVKLIALEKVLMFGCVFFSCPIPGFENCAVRAFVMFHIVNTDIPSVITSGCVFSLLLFVKILSASTKTSPPLCCCYNPSKFI